MKAEKGITLVALVITIVILIILAVVAINSAFGDNGLINHAERAKDYQANAVASDSELIDQTTDYIEGILGNGEDTEDTFEKRPELELEDESENEVLKLLLQNGKQQLLMKQ